MIKGNVLPEDVEERISRRSVPFENLEGGASVSWHFAADATGDARSRRAIGARSTIAPQRRQRCRAHPHAAGTVGADGRVSRAWQQRRLLKFVAFLGRARKKGHAYNRRSR